MKLSIKAGATSQTVNVWIQDSSSTTGAGLTGLAYNTASLVAYYALPKAAAVQITLATLAAVTSSWSSGGFKEIDATNMPGWYRFDIPNAALASGSFVSIHFKGATNMAPLPLEIALEAWDRQDAVRGGLTALPNANAEAAGGLYTRGTGAGQINQATNGQIDANAVKLAGTACTGRDIGASVLLSSGTGTGQLDFTSGAIKVQSNFKKNQALSNFPFVMTDSTTHNPATGKTVTVTRKLDSGAHGAGTLSAVTEIANGEYNVDFGAGDMNGNTVELRATASGCDDLFVTIITVP